MFRKCITMLVCALGAAATANADNLITVWDATGTFNLDQFARSVEITSDGVFKIQATGDHDGLGEIWSITVAYYVTGTVEVYILRRPEEGGGPGAYDVRLLNLSGDATTVIQECRVTHDLATDGNVDADELAGPMEVGHAIGHDIEVTGFTGTIECNSMRNLSVAGSSSPETTITIHGAYADTIYVNGPLG